MTRYIFSTIFVAAPLGLLLWTLSADAQYVSPFPPPHRLDPDAGVASLAPDASLPRGVPTQKQIDKLLQPEPPTTDLLGNSINAVKVAKEGFSSGTMTGIMAAVAAVLWVLIGILRRFGGNFLSGTLIRTICIFAGAVASLTGWLGMGMGWGEALQLFMAGPGAMALEESRKLFRRA